MALEFGSAPGARQGLWALSRNAVEGRVALPEAGHPFRPPLPALLDPTRFPRNPDEIHVLVEVVELAFASADGRVPGLSDRELAWILHGLGGLRPQALRADLLLRALGPGSPLGPDARTAALLELSEVWDPDAALHVGDSLVGWLEDPRADLPWQARAQLPQALGRRR